MSDDPLDILSSFADGVQGMGLGDPDDPAANRILASDVVRWAVAEIARLRLTDAEREAVEAAENLIDGRDGEWGDKIADTLRKMLERLA